jgi:hypothetical protein
MDALDKLAFINIVLPPYYIEPPCHISNCFAYFSSNLSQSMTLSLLADMGTSKYFIGNNSMLHLKISTYATTKSLSPPINNTSLFYQSLFSDLTFAQIYKAIVSYS